MRLRNASIFGAIGLSIGGVILIGSGIIQPNASIDLGARRAAPSQYSIVLEDVFDLPFNRYITANGNDIYFLFGGLNDYAGEGSGWKTLASSGYFKNTTAISGLLSISFTGSADLKISYGYYDDSLVFSSGVLPHDGTAFTFNDDAPTYFRIDNDSGEAIDIDRLAISYSCEQILAPEYSAENLSMLSFTYHDSSSPYYGVRKGSDVSGHVIVPSSYDDGTHGKLPVKRIEASGFSNCAALTTIDIPSTVTLVDDYSFYSCTSLSSIAIPSSVTYLGSYAFQYCSSLLEADIEGSLASIGSYTFNCCYKLASVTLPNTLTSIGAHAFESCYKLSSISLPSGLTQIGNGAFVLCESLRTVTIPSSVTSIDGNVFSGCTSLTSISVEAGNAKYSSYNGVLFQRGNSGDTLLSYPANKEDASYTIPLGVSNITSYAFRACKNLENVTIPEGARLTSVPSESFDGCTSLRSISLPSGITSISAYAFQNCRNLENVRIAGSITSIDGYAFYYCTSLVDIVLPASLDSIGWYAFHGCSGLKHAYYGGTSAPTTISSNNAPLTDHLYLYSESEPASAGLYWHYVDDVPTAW